MYKVQGQAPPGIQDRSKRPSRPRKPTQLSFGDLLPCHTPTAWHEDCFWLPFTKGEQTKNVLSKRYAQQFGKNSGIPKMRKLMQLLPCLNYYGYCSRECHLQQLEHVLSSGSNKINKYNKVFYMFKSCLLGRSYQCLFFFLAGKEASATSPAHQRFVPQDDQRALIFSKKQNVKNKTKTKTTHTQTPTKQK